MPTKQQRIKDIKRLIGRYKRERNYFKVDRLKNLLKRAKSLNP